MTPLEINKKIAEIKGFTGTLIDTNWAENISDAWELFEEMATDISGDVNCLNYSSFLKDYNVGVASDDGFESFANQDHESPSMAICLAYIEWKKECQK